jgi:hypothetical protein
MAARILYKNLLRYAKAIKPASRSEEVTKQIKSEFRKENVNAESIAQMLDKAQQSLSYLKMITPKKRLTQSEKDSIDNETKRRGTSVKKAISNWHGGNMDPDSVKRHYNGLKRAGFDNNAKAKGIF